MAKSFEDHSAALGERFTKSESTISALGERLLDLERKDARRRSDDGEPEVTESLGTQIANAEGVKAMDSHFRGKATVKLSRKAITSATSTVGSGRSPATSLAPSERVPGIITPPEKRFLIRDLIASSETEASAIEFVQETGFTNNAAMVVEGTQKPYSDLTFDLKSVNVRTIAHLFKASRQILDDTPGLVGYIDNRGTYGLKLKEEQQFFFGDGSGQNILGLVPQAAAYDTTRTKTGQQDLDVLLNAISQSEEADLPASGIVLSVRDWRRLLGIKDLGGNYLSDGPFGATAPRIWDLPVYPTNAFSPGRFLVGAFNTGGAQIFDRMDVEVLVSTENQDDFERNMVTIRIEERVAFAVYRPGAFVGGMLPGAA
ncbi:phage major capsid protein [Aureimonas sp. D3]|uniref:phage major capsid protein n=1 Tax=Aureimonas sp. D3 TaxID=1638164 RepID=UPI000785CF76